MKIVHICLCGAMTDGLSYQENLLSKYHRKKGYEVTVIASRYIWDNTGRIAETLRTNYFNEDGVKIVRLKIINGNIDSRLKLYKGLYRCVRIEKPEILFIHDCQFINIITLARYVKRYKGIRVFVDNHVDYSNGAHGWLSKNILHKGLWRFCVKRIEQYVEMFYGVLPARVDFLVDVYTVPKEKCELLVMGADDKYVDIAENSEVILNIRSKYKIQKDDFLIVSGGKINGYRPETLNLMSAVKKCNNSKVKLIIFGSVSEDLSRTFQELLQYSNIQYAGWLQSKDTYLLLKAANVVCFPGLHSVMWEQTVALGVPCIFRDLKGFHHVDIGGNAIFIHDPSEKNLKELILDLANNPHEMKKLSNCAKSEKRKDFLYSIIAERSLRAEENT